MDKDELLDILVYDYLKKKGLSNTALIFQSETQITGQTPPVYDQEPHGFLYDNFIKYCDEKYNNYRQQKNSKEELFQNFLYAHLKKKGLSNTAQSLQNEARITGQTPPEFDDQPNGLLSHFWNSYNRTSSQSQAPNVGAIIGNIPQIIRDGYFIQYLASFTSGQKLLSCDFSSDGNILASGGESGKPFICYMDTSQSVTTLETHLSTIFDVRFRPGSTIFATSSADKTVKLWDANRPGRSVLDGVGHNGAVRSLDFHPFREILCSSDIYDVIKVWDLNQRVPINYLRIDSFMRGSIVRFQPGSGKLLAVATQNVINIFEFPSSVVKNRLQGHVKNINSICWHVTGEMIASVSEDGVRVWSDGRCMYQYPSNGKSYQSVIFHPQYLNVLVIGGIQCLQLLIPETGKVRNKGGASDVSINGLAATIAQSKYIASASDDSVVKIWK